MTEILLRAELSESPSLRKLQQSVLSHRLSPWSGAKHPRFAETTAKSSRSGSAPRSAPPGTTPAAPPSTLSVPGPRSGAAPAALPPPAAAPAVSDLLCRRLAAPPPARPPPCAVCSRRRRARCGTSGSGRPGRARSARPEPPPGPPWPWPRCPRRRHRPRTRPEPRGRRRTGPLRGSCSAERNESANGVLGSSEAIWCAVHRSGAVRTRQTRSCCRGSRGGHRDEEGSGASLV